MPVGANQLNDVRSDVAASLSCAKRLTYTMSDLNHERARPVLDIRNAPRAARIERPRIVRPPAWAAFAVGPSPVTRQGARASSGPHAVSGTR